MTLRCLGHKTESGRDALMLVPDSAQTTITGHVTNPGDLGALLVFIIPANSTLASPMN